MPLHCSGRRDIDVTYLHKHLLVLKELSIYQWIFIRPKMCYKGKCFYCIPVENGCLVLAILSAIGNGLVLLACIILGFLAAAGIITASGIRDPDERQYAVAVTSLAGIAVGVVIAIVGVASLIAFIFSVLLCNGICNRRPGQVKSYFVYGVVITVLAVLAAILQMALDREPAPGLLLLAGCVIYSLFLVLVHQTYIKLCAGAVIKDHIRLVEDCAY